jgi:hypothetical protein
LNLSVPFQVFVRPELVDGRPVIAELRLVDPQGITGGDLRRLRLDQLEASLHGLFAPAAHVQKMTDALAPALEQVRRIDEALKQMPAPRLSVHARLKAPDTVPYPDEFFADVAESYLAALQMGERPGPFLADLWQVPITSVHGWIKQARRRGILAPGRKGKAG